MLLFFSFLVRSDMVWVPPAADMQPISCQPQSLTSWGPRIGCFQQFKCWAGWYLGSSCFSQSTQWCLDPIIIL